LSAKNSIPLGYIELFDGTKPIFPMNDIFLNYTFEDATYWEALRSAANIIIESFKQQKPDTKVTPIEGNIKVRTQFRYLLGKDNTTRDQDIKIIKDDGDSIYLEFQNRAKTDIPIEIRSVEYFGLGIGHSRGKLANQIWLLAKDVDSVLHGRTFARYILKDEITGNEYPTTSGIMYVSLTKLSQENSLAGELASFLLGNTSKPKNETVNKIAEAFKSSFDSFKNDKEVANLLTLAERYTHDGRVEGIEQGIEQGVAQGISQGISQGMTIGEANVANEARELLKKGIDPAEILRRIMSKCDKPNTELSSQLKIPHGGELIPNETQK
jgi:hypothetical protein